jgi:hypothetical protein
VQDAAGAEQLSTPAGIGIEVARVPTAHRCIEWAAVQGRCWQFEETGGVLEERVADQARHDSTQIGRESFGDRCIQK